MVSRLLGTFGGYEWLWGAIFLMEYPLGEACNLLSDY